MYGFTAEYEFNFRDKLEYYAALGVYVQKVSPEKVKEEIYYTFDTVLSIKENILRHLSRFDFYVQNVFFLESDDKEEYTFGFNMTFDLPSSIFIVFDLGQVFYDISVNGQRNNVLNSGFQIGVDF